VLPKRKQCQRIEDVTDRREHRVRRRMNERCIGHRETGFGVPDGGRVGQSGGQNYGRRGHCGSCAFRDSHHA
jgi:hypothetical protein